MVYVYIAFHRDQVENTRFADFITLWLEGEFWLDDLRIIAKAFGDEVRYVTASTEVNPNNRWFLQTQKERIW